VQLRVATDQPWAVPADVLAVPLGPKPAFKGSLGELDKRSGGGLHGLVDFGEFTRKRYATAIADGGDARSKRFLAVGMGDPATITRETVVRVGATAERRLGGRSVKRLAIWIGPLIDALGGDATAVAELVARGVVEGAYDPRTIYRDEVDSAPPVLNELILVAPDGDKSALLKAVERGVIMGEGSTLARTLSNRSSNDVSPQVLADEAKAIAKRHDLWIDVIDDKQATKLGMGMFMAVGRGSDNPPRMILLRSGKEGERDSLDRHLAIVGKGVCFDSGGISLKPPEHMEEMKMDKTGACTVIAAIATVARLAPGTPLLAVAPAVENMPGPHSTRPGDIVTALNGKKVDVINTDAEGRLILGDALTYAERLGATHLVDVATLTGAVHRALGHLITGAFGTPQSFYDDVVAAGDRAGERYWQLPLVDEYRHDMDSWYGDIVNTGTSEGGLVKSALFIREFVTKPWVHLDIAGTAYFRKTAPFAPKGATGVSHATLVELALAGAKAG
jgi:leucyl aminopeptidase